MNDQNQSQPPQSTDWNAERLAQLKALMPDLFTNEGKLNPDEFKQLIGEPVNDNERYEMRWHGKRAAKRTAFTPSTATLKFDQSRSVNPEHSQNLIIEGDNLEVLKLLSTAYREQVKMIYIDPPYNTGKDFVYSDNFTEGKQAYWQNAEVVENGVRIDTNTEADGRYHSNWLNMMYSRLLIARQLLRDDGVIFISIDDNEQANLKKLCDEVFGADCFVANIVWQKKYAATNDAKGFSNLHDHIVVYKKSDKFERRLLPRTLEMNKPYKNDDADGKGLWRSDNLLVKSFSNSGVYPIINPNTGAEYFPAEGSSWRASQETMKKWLGENRLFFGKDGKGAPQLKRYLNEVQNGQVPTTWWKFEDVGHNDAASKELSGLFESKTPFDTPKPTTLIRQMLKISSDTDSIILDFFAGSGTTAHAVMDLNLEDGGNRQYICVQLPELTDENGEAHKAGYTKISDITIARAAKVIDKLTTEQPEKVAALQSPMGFKVFQLTQSNFPSVTFAPDADKTEDENLADLQRYLAMKEAQLSLDFNPDHLITEVLLKQGFNLNYELSEVAGFDNVILRATDAHKSALVCLDGTLHDSTVAYFKTHSDERFICLERALNTTQKYNLKLNLDERFFAF